MTDKVHGFSMPGQHITGGLDFFSVYTTLDITPLEFEQHGTYVPSFTQGTYATNYQDTRVVDSQLRLDKLIETISTRAQPVIMGAVTTVTADASTADTIDLPAATAGTTLYTFTFAIEHPDAWAIIGNDPDINDTLNGVLDFVNVVPKAGNNVVITRISADTDFPKVF